MDQRQWEWQRNAPRIETGAAAEVRAYGLGAIDTNLVNVSIGGAMIAGVDGLARGDEVTLFTNGIEIVSTVAWVGEDHCGLRFHRDLRQYEIAKFQHTRGRAVAGHA